MGAVPASRAMASLPERAAALTDPARMQALLEEHLRAAAGAAPRVDACRVVHTRYRTSAVQQGQGKAFLTVGYEVAARLPGNDAAVVQPLLVKAYADGRSARAFEKARRCHGHPPAVGPAVAHLPELDAVLWGFPNDPRLPYLPEVIDPVRLRRHLPAGALPAGDVAVDVVRYKPEVRCITRYRVGESPGIFGKTFRHGRGGEIARRIAELGGRLDGDPSGFVVAAALGYADDVRTVWQAEIPGTRLADLVAGGGFRAHLDAAARGLARLHAIELPGLPYVTIAGRLRAVSAEAGEVAVAFPHLTPRLAAVARRLEADAAGLPAVPAGLVHGDFLLKQLLVDGERLGLCDFDNLCRGDPTRDVANFVVDLHFHGLDPAGARTAATTFVRAYGGRLPRARLWWHVRAQVLSSLYYLHKRHHLRPGFAGELGGLVGLAEDEWIDV